MRTAPPLRPPRPDASCPLPFAVAPKFNDDEENDTDRDGNDAWVAMEHEEQESFLKAFFVKGGPIRKYLGELISKARTEKMNADLKRLARETMPELIPFTNDPTADVRVTQSSPLRWPCPRAHSPLS